MRPRRVVAGVTLLLSAACGLDIVGVVPGGVDGGPVTEAGAITDAGDRGTTGDDGWTAPPDGAADLDAGLPTSDAATACAVVDAGCKTTNPTAAGWTPLTIGLAENGTCPTGFLATAVMTAPAALAGACDCAPAANPIPPTCQSGMIDFLVGPGCTAQGLMVRVDGGSCTHSPGTVGDHSTYAAFGLTGGGCTSATLADPTKVQTQPLTLCAAASCDDALCANEPPPGYQACLAASGDIPCPNATFATKHVVGTEPSVACSSCACTASAVCNPPNVDLFADDTCTMKVISFASAVCTDTGSAKGKPVKAVEYTATSSAPTYAVTGPKTATNTGFVAPITVCCAGR